jgi:hypothetical protein
LVVVDNKPRLELKSESVQLSDGGVAEVTDLAPVPLGDDGARAYRQLTYTRDADGDCPGCQIVFEIRNRVLVCASFTLSTKAETGVRAKDLRVIKLDELARDLYSYIGVFRPNPTGSEWVRVVGPASIERNRETIEQAKRRKITPEFLQRVAEVHQSAPAGERLYAVKAAFPASDGSPLSERQALRYIAQARREGLIVDG